MNTLLILGFCSFFLALVLTPFIRRTALRFGLVDRPDKLRKFHDQPIPRVGGIAIFLAYLGAYGLLLLFTGEGTSLWSEHRLLLWQLLPAAGLMFGVGLLDDILTLRPWQKLLGQFMAANWVYWTGVHIANVGPWDAHGWLAWPLTVFWLLSCTNAFNLIDGVDGLASGVGLFATCTTLLAALLTGNTGLALATVPLAGCLLGFLRYNFNPASIFLGDCGSLTIGFLLGCYGAIWSQKSATLLGLVAPMMAMALPLLDVALSIARRFLRQQPIFGADRGHIHHRLLARGWSPRSVALVLYAVCGVAAVLSLLQSVLYEEARGAIVVLFCAVAWSGVQHLGYLEFDVARQMLGGAFRDVLRDTIHVRHLQQRLTGATTLEECWMALQEACRELGFQRVLLDVQGKQYEAAWSTGTGHRLWRFEIALSAATRLVLERSTSGNRPTAFLPLVEALQDALLIRETALQTSAPQGALVWSCLIEPAQSAAAVQGK